MVSALFVRSDSIYKKLGVDCWDIGRDAKNFAGPGPVICHPPCRTWGILKQFSKGSADEHELAFFALDVVRKNGGVLEHPSGSNLWLECNLPLGKNIDRYKGFTLSINQHWFGHKARKKTLLYICGINQKDVPAYPLNFDAVTHVLGPAKHGLGKKELTKADRERTPELLAKWLVQICQLIELKK